MVNLLFLGKKGFDLRKTGFYGKLMNIDCMKVGRGN